MRLPVTQKVYIYVTVCITAYGVRGIITKSPCVACRFNVLSRSVYWCVVDSSSRSSSANDVDDDDAADNDANDADNDANNDDAWRRRIATMLGRAFALTFCIQKKSFAYESH